MGKFTEDVCKCKNLIRIEFSFHVFFIELLFYGLYAVLRCKVSRALFIVVLLLLSEVINMRLENILGMGNLMNSSWL